MNETIMQMKN